MKFYIVDFNGHHKNVHSIRRMLDSVNIPYTTHSDLSSIDETYTVAICMVLFFPPDKFPKTCKVIYGPQFFVFPDDHTHPIHSYAYDPDRFFYNSLCGWNMINFKQMAPKLTLTNIACPFGIDIEHIAEVPPQGRTDIMVYFKHRRPECLSAVTTLLNQEKVVYKVFRYGSYVDADFKRALQNTKFVIWIGSHESQGFAFQETLTSNVPILVWDVKSMHDEYINGVQWTGYTAPLLATAANVWSDKCGIKIYSSEELPDSYNEMNLRLATFSPRNVIAATHSLESTYHTMIRQIGL
jgi:hypothetical protein